MVKYKIIQTSPEFFAVLENRRLMQFFDEEEKKWKNISSIKKLINLYHIKFEDGESIGIEPSYCIENELLRFVI